MKRFEYVKLNGKILITKQNLLSYDKEKRIICRSCQSRIVNKETDLSNYCNECAALNNEKMAQEMLFDFIVEDLQKGNTEIKYIDYLLKCLQEYKKGIKPDFTKKKKSTSSRDIPIAYEYYLETLINDVKAESVNKNLQDKYHLSEGSIYRIIQKYEEQAICKLLCTHPRKFAYQIPPGIIQS